MRGVNAYIKALLRKGRPLSHRMHGAVPYLPPPEWVAGISHPLTITYNRPLDFQTPMEVIISESKLSKLFLSPQLPMTYQYVCTGSARKDLSSLHISPKSPKTKANPDL